MPTHTGVAATVATASNPALGTGTGAGTSPATAEVARGGSPRSLFKAHVTPGLAGGLWPEPVPEPEVVAGDGEQENACGASSSTSASSCQATNHTTRASSGGPSAHSSQSQSTGQSQSNSNSNSQPTIRVGFASRYFTASQDVGAMVQGLLPLLARPYAPTTSTSTSTAADDAVHDDGHGGAAWRHGTVEIHTFLIGQPDGGVDLATATDPVLRRCLINPLSNL